MIALQIGLGVAGVLLQVGLLALLLRQQRADAEIAAMAEEIRQWLVDARRITNELERQVKKPAAYHTRPQ